jgi:multicomponent Na+:H+ antiporter subunit E
MPWGRLLAYAPWLLVQVVLASLHVAQVVLSPKMPIRPRLVRFRADLPGEVAHLTLANSITLTPGTVTVDRHGDEYLIHALTDDTAGGLLGGDMQRRVGRVFGVVLRNGSKGGDA